MPKIYTLSLFFLDFTFNLFYENIDNQHFPDRLSFSSDYFSLLFSPHTPKTAAPETNMRAINRNTKDVSPVFGAFSDTFSGAISLVVAT